MIILSDLLIKNVWSLGLVFFHDPSGWGNHKRCRCVDLIDRNSFELRFWSRNSTADVGITAEGWFRLKVWSRRFIAIFWRVVKIEGRLSSMLRINVALLNGKPELLTLLPSCTVHDVRTEAQRAFGKKHLRTYHCEESSPSGSWQNLRRSRHRGRRVPYSSGTSTTTCSNRRCLCLVVSWLSWRKQNRYLG